MALIPDDDVLFQECIEALKPNIAILSRQTSDEIFEIFERSVPFIEGGSRINWQKMNKKITINSLDQVIPALEQLSKKTIDTSVYVLWNDAFVPVIKTDLHSILVHFDDVISVGFETWFYNPTQGYIIEYYYLGDMSVGLVKPYHQLIDVTDAKFIEDTRTFLQEIEHESAQRLIPKLPVIEEKINTILLKIKSCDQAYEAKTYFDLLQCFKDLFKKLIYKEHMEVSDSLRKFAKDFNRIDLQWLREAIFNQLK